MSVWTHVAGIVRLDGIKVLRPYTKKKVEEVFGKMVLYDDEEDTDQATVPYGSEGSLQYLVHEYGEGLPWCVVSIWGDLRDYDRPGEVVGWLDRVLSHKMMMVRSAVLEIYVEGDETQVYCWSKDN